jgi:hypothetical protein
MSNNGQTSFVRLAAGSALTAAVYLLLGLAGDRTGFAAAQSDRR